MKMLKYQLPNLWAVLWSSYTLFSGCQQAEQEITYSKDIAPIIIKNCSPCHRTNGGAPFSLTNYFEVAKKAKMIATVTRNGYMPPWPADKNYTHFIDEKGLSASEIELIQKWVKQGKKPGDTTTTKLPEFKNIKSILGKPDLIIKVPPISIYNNNTDQFYLLKIPYKLPFDTFVRCVEFVPNQKKYVHHVNGHYYPYPPYFDVFKGQAKVETFTREFTTGYRQLGMILPDNSIPDRIHSAFNYLPGTFGVMYPKGIGGFTLSKNGIFLANDIHYGPSKINTIDSSELYLYFSDKKPERQTFEIMLGTNGISPIVPPLKIPANTISKHISEVTIYNDISVLTINPHMHLLGKSLKAYAIKPNGDTIRLISIPKWRFQWQYFYTFRSPVRIPKGSTIRLEAVFDNTSNNPNNPFNPPQLIGERWDFGGSSMRTTDEMLQLIITYMPYQSGDEKIDLSKR